ncbi:MAG: integral rane sensor signal transduction histidine kinase [Bacteroidetes bacterium]|nr:integral rane sensor signal transduction histidine kinase [Bacteroidota bacterium]
MRRKKGCVTMKGDSPRETSPLQTLEEGLPQFEQFIESRESYIKALEQTILMLKQEAANINSNSLAIRSSVDELVAMQRLSNTISTALEPELIVSTLIELTRQVIPVIESNIFLFEGKTNKVLPLSSKGSSRLQQEAQEQMEAGIVDWVIAEKKTVVIPDLDHMVAGASNRNFVIVPLLVRGQGIGIYLIHTVKSQPDFSNQDLQLLSVLANQAAAGVENWRTYRQLVRANEELKSSQAQMVQAAKMAAIGELAAGVAHEIKNPLQVLLLHLELVEKGRPVANWTEMFSKQVKRLGDITRRLMDFARNVSEEVKMEPVHINKTIEETAAMVQHEFAGSGITIAANLPDGIPPVAGNANYLQQVFLNLLLNARDAMPKGGTIGLSTESTGFHIIVRISDTGMGIEKEILDKIFRPFFTTKGDKGTGLGLAVCHKIIGQHKGDIRVQSEVGKGTTFTMFLPVWRGVKN